MKGKWASEENKQLFEAVTFPTSHWSRQLAGEEEPDLADRGRDASSLRCPDAGRYGLHASLQAGSSVPPQ